MELADILAEGSVFVCSSVKNKTEILHKLADVAAGATGGDAEAIFEALNDREALGSTGLGNGIAIPHGKLSKLDSVTAVFVKLETPIDFDAVDDQKVDLLMMLLAPVGAGADHLKALARVARLLRNEQTVEALRDARDAAELYSILTQPLPTTKAA
jgi:PTS system nitrogen regulatory IIA component